MTSSDWIGAWQLINTLVPYAALWWVALWSLHGAPWLLPPVIAVMVLFLARCFSPVSYTHLTLPTIYSV